MAIDPSISLRVQGIEAPNPLIAYGQVAQIQNAQNQNALAQYQLGAAKRTDEQQNALNKIIAENYDQSTGQINMKGLVGGLAAGGHGALIPQQLAAEQERQTKAATLQKTHAEIVGLQKKYVDDVARNLSADPSDSNIIKHAQGIQQGNFSAELKSWAADQEKILLGMKPDQRKAYLEKSGATAGDFVSAANNAATVAEQARGHTMTNAREGQRIANAENPNVVARQVVGENGTVTNFNKFGKVIGTVEGAGKQSATYAKTEAQKKTLGKDLDLAISELANVTKDGGLIDQSTGSYIGKGVDIGARAFGKATSGDIAAGKLAPIADLALKMVPRFEGPQSNADTTSYKQAAGQLADTTLPTEIRKEAGKEVLRLMKARKNQFITSDMASGNTATSPGVAPPEGFVQD
jgi:hypothetical protein